MFTFHLASANDLVMIEGFYSLHENLTTYNMLFNREATFGSCYEIKWYYSFYFQRIFVFLVMYINKLNLLRHKAKLSNLVKKIFNQLLSKIGATFPCKQAASLALIELISLVFVVSSCCISFNCFIRFSSKTASLICNKSSWFLVCIVSFSACSVWKNNKPQGLIHQQRGKTRFNPPTERC